MSRGRPCHKTHAGKARLFAMPTWPLHVSAFTTSPPNFTQLLYSSDVMSSGSRPGLSLHGGCPPGLLGSCASRQRHTLPFSGGPWGARLALFAWETAVDTGEVVNIIKTVDVTQPWFPKLFRDKDSWKSGLCLFFSL